MIKPLLLIFLGFVSLNAYSQNCGGEFQPETGTCRIIGPDGKVVMYNSSPPQSESSPAQKKIIQTTIVHKASKYGALALNKRTGYTGGAVNMASKDEAKREALRSCEQAGGTCQVIVWAKNGCIAAVQGRKGNKWILFKNVAENPSTAEQSALNRCTSSGLAECRVLGQAGCSIPDGMYD